MASTGCLVEATMSSFRELLKHGWKLNIVMMTTENLSTMGSLSQTCYSVRNSLPTLRCHDQLEMTETEETAVFIESRAIKTATCTIQSSSIEVSTSSSFPWFFTFFLFIYFSFYFFIEVAADTANFSLPDTLSFTGCLRHSIVFSLWGTSDF